MGTVDHAQFSTAGDTHGDGLKQHNAAHDHEPHRHVHASHARGNSRGLTQAELLAKINALDWDETLPMPNWTRAQTPSASSRRIWLLMGAVLIAVLAALLSVKFLLVDGKKNASAESSPELQVVTASSAVGAVVAQDSDAEVASRLAAVEAQEQARKSKLDEAVRLAEENRRKAAFLRKAQEDEEHAREREAQEQRRLMAEAARRSLQREYEPKMVEAPPQPQGPSSPQELCAGETNFFSRGICESKACGLAEWRKHPYCVKRMEEQLRRLNQGG